MLKGKKYAKGMGALLFDQVTYVFRGVDGSEPRLRRMNTVEES